MTDHFKFCEFVFVFILVFQFKAHKKHENKRMKQTNMDCNVTNYFILHSKMCNCFGYIVTYSCVVGVRINTMHFNSWITFVIISFWILTLFYLLLIDLFQFLMNNMNKWNDNKGESEKSNKNNNWCFWYKLQIRHIILLRNYLCAKNKKKCGVCVLFKRNKITITIGRRLDEIYKCFNGDESTNIPIIAWKWTKFMLFCFFINSW